MEVAEKTEKGLIRGKMISKMSEWVSLQGNNELKLLLSPNILLLNLYLHS